MILEVNNLTISYNNNPIIKNLSFFLEENSILGLSGKNGSGKTSLCLSLAGILDQASIDGSITIQKQNIKDMSIAQRSKSVGIVFQQPDEQIFSPLVEDEIVFGLENLCFERDIIAKRLDQVLETLEISHLQKQKTNNLSAGQKQLVAIASVLAMKPKILITDEICSALDKPNKAKVRKILKNYAANSNAVIIASHNQEDLAICDKIIELDRGMDED